MRADRGQLRAILCSAKQPSPEQMKRFTQFLLEKYQRKVPVVWEQDSALRTGFRLQVGSDIYDWTPHGRLRQFQDYLRALRPGQDDLLPLMREAVQEWDPAINPEEIGEVLTVGSEIATVGGLEHAQYGEILVFDSGVKGMVQDLRENDLSCILFGDSQEITAGSMVRRTMKTAAMRVGDGFLGRVVDALGIPVDGKGHIEAETHFPMEAPAPGILERQPVNTPMETGLLAIDSMFPIGRGQRELIIGDRQTGKTAIALDTILNQKGKGVVCIYVAIGQKTSSIAQLVENLSRRGAMDYTTVVSAPAGASAALQYIAPYAGCALGEYFMRQGRDVLIVYDDLSKHAIAYRALSLLLERSPGREAYPGDVFYLHSRLLERAAHLSDELGGGSMTALPIVETQAGDVSAYIPTNIISITDGQIFLEADLFFAGQRPAVNVGLSVSRVGGDAQTKAMKSAAGAIRLDLAQYREMEVFTQFSSDLDEATKRQLAYGQGLMRLLRQPQYAPFSQHQQVIILVAAMAHVMQEVGLEELDEFREKLLAYVEEEAPDICRRADQTGQLFEDDREEIIALSKEYLEKFRAGKGGN
ncbi:F0F1 ATP synthase subunit alpha [Neglecta sp. X4]|uniref:F0F1 ATP synthase subunit alpha n=1 Tax=unclassified Neglectibacter TaxID=2632164 RepID=UPI001368EE1E|nr:MULTISPECIES: F0F1 ATP synthase subunit alpha [unclassified Neglectibacter]NBI16254.1 F0F1 ATP synthase subunit alpha [Neglectibacter sp. 59]NBJ71951.1 F0F1 ATP synthase subunit alpha [Neglectibacter sp. X4]NCE79728.1 F0F1 ATP synthase subunit alpha [Neglectibacter sp. X58]